MTKLVTVSPPKKQQKLEGYHSIRHRLLRPKKGSLRLIKLTAIPKRSRGDTHKIARTGCKQLLKLTNDREWHLSNLGNNSSPPESPSKTKRFLFSRDTPPKNMFFFGGSEFRVKNTSTSCEKYHDIIHKPLKQKPAQRISVGISKKLVVTAKYTVMPLSFFEGPS